MNNFYLGKLEACITLADGDDKKFISYCKKVFDTTEDEVMMDTRLFQVVAMMWDSEDTPTIIDAVI